MGSLRRSAWMVVAAALLPLLLFFTFQSGFAARQERTTIENRALALTQQIATATDGIVERHFVALNAIATARSLGAGSIEEFRSRGAEIIALNRDWVGLELIDLKTGKVLTALSSPAGPRRFVVDGPPQDMPRLAGFARGAGCPCVMFDRMSSAPSGQRWALRAFVSTKEIFATLPPPRQQYEVAGIVGPQGRFVARTLDDDRRFGEFGTRYLRAAVASGKPHGVYRGFTLEGFENFTAFSRSPLTGWSAHVALDSAYIDRPASRFLASLGLAAVLSLLLAGVLIWFALRQLAQARQIDARLEQSQKLEALGQLTGGIAHDFNNLLTPIVGALDFLAKQTDLGPRPRRMAENALAAANRAGKLTGQLLAFSRRQKMVVTPVDLTAMIEDMRPLIDQSVGSHPVRIAVPAEQVCGLTDLHQLELAILNLVMNARDASNADSPIDIAVLPTEEEVAIAVTDRGTGMTEAVRQRAVEPFFTTKQVGSGTGLGLAQAFGVARQSDGRLEIESAPGEGTTVTIHLRRCDLPAAQAAGEEPAIGQGKAMKILLVDDDDAVRRALADALEHAGHEVESFASGAAGLSAMADTKFDVAVVDYRMPEMNGDEFIARAQAVRADQRFVMVTGYVESELLLAAAPDVALIRKPVAPAELVAAVVAAAA